MDIQRIVLFAGLAIVSYLMVLAWNEDYHQPVPTEQVAESTRVQTDNRSAGSDAMVLPGETAQTRENPADEEFATPEAGQSPATTVQSDVSVNDQYISVRTDVLDLVIDRVSGNLVKSSLLAYDKSLNSEEPLTLLNNTENRFYVLESGLIGQDGPDSSRNGQAPVYETDATSYELAEGENQLTVNLVHTMENGVHITKRYQFARDSYEIDVRYLIDNRSEANWQANFTGKIVRDKSPDPTSGPSMGISAFLGLVTSTPDKPYEKFDFGDLEVDVGHALTRPSPMAGWRFCSIISLPPGYLSVISQPSSRPLAVARCM